MTTRIAKLLQKTASPIERATALYSRLAAVETVKAGRFLSRGKATVTIESQDVVNNSKTRKMIRLEASKGAISIEGPGMLIDAKTALHYSPSGKRSVSCTKTGETFRFDICSAMGLDASISGAPSQPIADPNLQYISWRADESGFVFVGEKSSPKSARPWDIKPTASEVELSVASAKSTWETKDNWGECFADNSCFTLFYADIQAGTVVDLIDDGFSKDWSSVSPLVVSSKDDDLVLFTAVEQAPRRLGIVYCRNRPSKAHTVKLGGERQKPTLVPSVENFRGMFNARIFDDKVAFFSQAREGSKTVPQNFPHNGAASLHVTTVEALLNPTADASTFYDQTLVVPIVYETPADPDNGFHGLYPPTGNDMWWVKNGSAVVVGSVARSSTKLFLVDLDSKQVEALPCCRGNKTGQWSVLDGCDSDLLVHHSHLLEGSSVGFVSVDGPSTDMLNIDVSFPFEELQSEYETEVIRCPDAHDSEAIYTYRRGDEKRPTVVIVHGGPHSTDTNSFICPQMLYLLHGWNLFSINYGGSLGFGHHRIQELMGTVGTNDVNDCVACVRAMNGRWDSGKLIVYGGSHGGFLSGHLTGQYPSMFKAAIIRNPVMNIASAHYETDIPDWTLAVCDIDEKKVDIAKMFNMSPIVHASAVTAATLLGIGLEDRRVLPLQGKSWYHALKAAPGKPLVRMIEYPENSHPLDGVHAAADFAIRGVVFASDSLSAAK